MARGALVDPAEQVLAGGVVDGLAGRALLDLGIPEVGRGGAVAPAVLGAGLAGLAQRGRDYRVADAHSDPHGAGKVDGRGGYR